MGYSRGIRGIYVCIGYVSGMYRVCIGNVSGMCRKRQGASGASGTDLRKLVAFYKHTFERVPIAPRKAILNNREKLFQIEVSIFISKKNSFYLRMCIFCSNFARFFAKQKENDKT